MTLRNCLLVVCLFTASVTGVVAQAIVSGQVTTREGGEPLAGVYVIRGRGSGTVTDEKGLYHLSIPAGGVTLTFSYIGYTPVTRTLEAAAGRDTITLDIRLEQEAHSLDQVVVSADRMEQKRSDLTVSMDVIRSDYLFRTHITDAQELITKTPGIEVLDGQASVRGGSGFSYGAGSRVLALVDGLPMMSADAGNIKWHFLPLENLAQVEIIKGASSVLYGSSALNGVINFRSADASNVPLTTFFVEGGIFGAPSNRDWKWWDSPRLFANASFSHLQRKGNSDLSLGLSLSSGNGYRKYNSESLGRLSLRLKQHSSRVEGLSYGLSLSGGTTDRTDFVLWEEAERGALRQDTSTVARLHGWFFAADPFLSFTKRGHYSHDLKMRIQSSSNRFPVRSNNDSDALSLYSEYQFRYEFTGRFSLTGGLAGTTSIIESQFYGDHRGVNLAAFAQAEVRPVERLKLTAGVRLEKNILDSDPDRLVPVFRSGLNFQAAQHTFVRASFGQGYRYPSVAERHAATTLGSVRIFPSPAVRAESGWSAETGVMHGFRAGRIQGEADLSVFISQNSDMIEYLFGIHYDPSDGTSGLGFKATNVEHSRITGSELELRLSRQIGKMSGMLTGGYTFIYPVEYNAATGRSTGTFLKYRRQHTAKLGLTLSSDRFEAGTDLYVRSKTLNIDDVFLNEATREEILPGFYDYWLDHNRGYLVADGSISYSLTASLKLSLAVKNITNTEYMGRPGDIQPHRNYSLRLSGRF